MSEVYRGDDAVQDAIKNLFLGAIPERQAEIDGFWSSFNMNFQLHTDKHPDGNYVFDAGMYRFVRFNQRVLRIFWIGSFSAMAGYAAIVEDQNHKVDDFVNERDRIFDAHASGDISSQERELNLSVLLSDLISCVQDKSSADFTTFNALIESFEHSTRDEFSDEKPLPAGIPEPGELPDRHTDPINRGTAEIAIIALAWAYLHEVKHILHQQGGTSYNPYSFTQDEAHKEEFSCDEFATDFILKNIEEYCIASDCDVSRVSLKRKLAIYCALFSLTLLTKDKWESSDTHPSLQERIDKVQGILNNPKNETLEAIVTPMFTALRNIWPSAPYVKF